jgi:proteasome lid subunit RPN8/RPN11
VRLPQALYDELVGHALADDNEVCGMVAGRDGVATRVLPVRNAHAFPARNYMMDPNDQHRVFTDIEDAGEDLLAIYHSHPPVGAYFSETDLNDAFVRNPDTGEEWLAWPGVLYIVVGLRPRGEKVFSVAPDRTVTEVPLEVVRGS